MSPQVHHLVEKLEQLSPERLSEVADFIEFLQLRDEQNRLRQDFTLASEAAFAKVWENDADAIYDAL